MSVTIKDVAKASGVSQQTAWRILSGNGENHNADTRARVQKTADELGYRAHSSAKAMRSGRFGSVALLLSEIPQLSLLPSELREGIQDVLNENEINLILSRFGNEDLTSRERTPRILREIMADGLLINYNADLPQLLTDIIAQYKIPAVWINSRQPADCVYPDDRDAGRRATERLLSLGHRNIAFAFVAETSHYSFAERIAGYEEAMTAERLPPRRVQVPLNRTSYDAIFEGTSFMGGDDQITGFVAYAQEPLALLLDGALIRRRKIPQEIAFIAVHDHPFSRMGMPVDTMLLPEREVGRAAAQMLLDKIAAPDQPQKALTLPLSLVAGVNYPPA